MTLVALTLPLHNWSSRTHLCLGSVHILGDFESNVTQILSKIYWSRGKKNIFYVCSSKQEGVFTLLEVSSFRNFEYDNSIETYRGFNNICKHEGLSFTNAIICGNTRYFAKTFSVQPISLLEIKAFRHTSQVECQ